MRHGFVVLVASLLLIGCGDAKRQQPANADIAFDTTGDTASGPVGRSEITGIDAALGDAAEMPADSAMVVSMPSPANTSGAAGGERAAAAPVVAPPPVLPVAPAVVSSGS